MRREYGQYCPVALATESLAERWTFLVVRELIMGARRFNEIRRGVPRMSATLLTQRLQTLEHAGIVERHPGDANHGPDYRLTKAGLALKPVVFAIGEWGHRWARDLKPIDFDPRPLVWSMHRRLNTTVMPPGRTVIALEFVDQRVGQRYYWFVHEAGLVDVCFKDPGYDATIRVVTRVRTLIEVWRGFRSMKDEVRAGTIQLHGAQATCRAFPQWLLLSAFAHIRRERPPVDQRDPAPLPRRPETNHRVGAPGRS